MAQHEQEAHGKHPGPAKYVLIGVILAIITAIEVAAFYIPAATAVVVSVLLSLSFAKFILVVGYFMHLKFDDKRFAALFVAPFIGMVSIAVALLAMFGNL